MSDNQYITRRVNGFFYSEFGTLKSVDVIDRFLVITNEHGHERRKSKVYASWTTSKTKLEQLIDKPLITRAPADSAYSSKQWFSDAIVNEFYTARKVDENGVVTEITHRLLQAPKEGDELTRELLFEARIQKQYAVENALRLAKYERYSLEEDLQVLKEEREQLSATDKESVVEDTADVRKVVEQWIAQDAVRPFGVFGYARSRGKKLAHIDKQFAMRYRFDSTRSKRLDVAVKAYLDKNYILGDIIRGNEVIECAMAIARRHEDNSWMIKTVRPLKQTARHYQLEREVLGDNKDAPEPLGFWYDVFDKVTAELRA
jgi:hypothetical protein